MDKIKEEEATEEEAISTSTPTPTLNELILNHANAHAALGNKKKAQAYKELVAESHMPTMQAIAAAIADNGVGPLEQLTLDLAAIAIAAD